MKSIKKVDCYCVLYKDGTSTTGFIVSLFFYPVAKL